MPVNPNTNRVEKTNSNNPQPEVEDIFSHEEGDVSTVAEKMPEQPRPEQPERQVEQPVEQPVEREALPETKEAQTRETSREDEIRQMQPAPPPTTQAPTETVREKSMELVKIENILSENLDELFMQMTPQQQMQFKEKGEETATKIEALLQETKVRVKEIINLIKDWLKIIPGVNKFFLEQEAKIKTDRLLNIREQKK